MLRVKHSTGQKFYTRSDQTIPGQVIYKLFEKFNINEKKSTGSKSGEFGG